MSPGGFDSLELLVLGWCAVGSRKVRFALKEKIRLEHL